MAALFVKLPGLIGLVPVYPDRDRPLTKHISWRGDYIRPIGGSEDISLIDEKKKVDPDYRNHRPN
ncbi:MAG TPA: hypothetical protein VL996_06285 [Methylocella sp.]|nr:hypothetical protein [Methylocella sp.]